MNLRPRFLILTALLFLVSAIAVSWSVSTLAEGIIERWAPRFIIKQALYDKSRTLQPILRELALSRQLATSEFIKEWANSPNDKDLTSSALLELENYRQNFQDNNYFVAFLSNGSYYHNNAQNEYSGKEFRYTLDPKKDADSWFYDLIEQKRDIHINVNPDIELGITKLWADVLIRDGDNILGIVGTGLDLTDFLNNVVEENDPGVTSLFIDHSGAIQLHRDKTLIDFGSISKDDGSHKTIDLIFKNDEDRKEINKALGELEAREKTVATVFVNVLGKRQLVGIVYLPEIDWYEITLIDLGTILPLSHFSTIVLVYILTLLAALILFNFALNRLVISPIRQLDRAIALTGRGENPSEEIHYRGRGEIGRLIKHFTQMAQTLLESRRDLEQKVLDRTAALERLTQIDPLTELYNRRGMTEQIEAKVNLAQRNKSLIGLLWLDIDWFKELNDTHGHAAGDLALKAVANIIRNTLRSYDLAARWGGDEFLVLVQPADDQALADLAERLLKAITTHKFEIDDISLSVSIGGYVSGEDIQIESLLQNADQALYEAKASGRNCYRAY